VLLLSSGWPHSWLSFSTELSPLSDMVETEDLSYSLCGANEQEYATGCQYYGHLSGDSLLYVNRFTSRTLSCRHSFGFSEIIILLILASMCLMPCDCDGRLDCSKYNVSCYHGTCVEAKLPVRVVCVCDDHWSGPACDVFSCSGRTL